MTIPQTDPSDDAASLEAAFDMLRKYDQGSARGVLLALDRAIVACRHDEPGRKHCEEKLLSLLRSGVSAAATEYICSKLAIIATGTSARALAAALNDSRSSASVLTALQALPGDAAGKALLSALPTLARDHKIGAIHVLGFRRQAGCERALTRLLKHEDPGIAGAAAAALGEVGSEKAAKALTAFIRVSPVYLRALAADACLACAERLLATGRTQPAKALCDLVQAQNLPEYIREAAQRIKLAAT